MVMQLKAVTINTRSCFTNIKEIPLNRCQELFAPNT